MAARDDRTLLAIMNLLKDRKLDGKIVKKSDSLFMKLCAIPLYPFNRRFMTGYSTAIPFLGRVYVSQDSDKQRLWRTMAHETAHLFQGEEGQLKFALSYLFPQTLSLVALGAILAIWWAAAIWFLLALVFLLPWPAEPRRRYEQDAYVVTMACDKLLGIDIEKEEYVERMIKNYTGWGYYKPVWRRKTIAERVLGDIFWAGELARNPRGFWPGPKYIAEIVATVKDAYEA